MSRVAGVNKINNLGIIYLSGRENTNDSVRLIVDEDGAVCVEKRIGDVWQPGSFRLSFDNIITTNDGGVFDNIGNYIIITN